MRGVKRTRPAGKVEDRVTEKRVSIKAKEKIWPQRKTAGRKRRNGSEWRKTWGPVVHTPSSWRIRERKRRRKVSNRAMRKKEEFLRLVGEWQERETSPIVRWAWAECEDDEGKDEEEQETERERQEEAEGRKEQEQEGEGETGERERDKASDRARGADERETTAFRAKGRKQARGGEKSTGGARAEESAGGAEEEKRRAQEAREEKRAQEVQEERKGQEEREKEARAQEGHEGKEEMTTQEECIEEKKETYSMQEDNDVSNRHMLWWKNSWWFREDNGPHLRTARGRRRTWRAARRAAEQARDEDRVEETQSLAQEAEGKKWGRRKGERDQTTQCKHSTPRDTLARQPNSHDRNNRNNLKPFLVWSSFFELLFTESSCGRPFVLNTPLVRAPQSGGESDASVLT